MDSSTPKQGTRRGVLEPALQGWGRPWVLCASAVYTAAAEANNRGNAIFLAVAWRSCTREGLGITPHTGVPKGSVCVHDTNSTFELAARPGRSRIAYMGGLSVYCVVQMVEMTTFRVIFMTFRSQTHAYVGRRRRALRYAKPF